LKDFDGRKRVVIENVSPEIDSGQFAIKRIVGEEVVVRADVFVDGHDEVSAFLLYRKAEEEKWKESPMTALANDRWEGSFAVDETGLHYYTIMGRIDHFRTWQKDLEKKFRAGQDISVALLIGSQVIDKASGRAQGEDAVRLQQLSRDLSGEKDQEKAFLIALSEELSRLMEEYPSRDLDSLYVRDLPLVADREKALFSTWYELFPRSAAPDAGSHGSFRDCERLLPEIARMGFDVLYFPPVHPIGRANRKGKNNSPIADPDAPGSPWAIGSAEGGHKSVHPELGTLEEFEKFVRRAAEAGLEVALDIALQCSPDHPYVREHPGWFNWRPDGTIQFAENPPKKYEDIVPFDFECAEWRALWEELRSIFFFWVERGVRIFRVDNPHTKPFRFWDWLIREVKKIHPEVIFLAEAFTRPKVMYRLAKGGFTQSYTYFTWRTTKQEITGYIEELTMSEAREFFRPNFWPNTPDILHEYLQYGGRPAFMVRLILAATLSSNYGIYGPAFEVMADEAVPGREEYLNSEKYEIHSWEWKKPGSLNDFIARVNRIRRDNPALRTTWNVRFFETDNEHILFYVKSAADFSNVLFVIVNLDPFHKQTGRVRVPLHRLGISPGNPYLVHDLLSDDKFIWQGEWNYVELNPGLLPAYIFRVKSRLRREEDFDYFM
jgi:starch synthase (maltosyl-transferring)